MMWEVLVILAPLIGGVLLLRALGLTGWGLVPLGFLAGLFLEVSLGILFLTMRLPLAPGPIVIATVALPAGFWLVRAVRSRDVGLRILPAAATVVGAAGLVGLFREAQLVRAHVDSFAYLHLGQVMALNDFGSVYGPWVAMNRPIGVPLLHASAAFADDIYVHALTPLVAIATLWAFAWLAMRGLARRVDWRVAAVFTALAIVFLASANRFVFHTFYINGHLLTGAAVLVVAGGTWLMAREGRELHRPLTAVIALAAAAAVAFRPEGGLLVLLAMLPALLSVEIPVAARRTMALALALSGGMYYGLAVVAGFVSGNDPGLAAVGMLAMSAVVGVYALTLGFAWFATSRVRALPVLEIGVWAALAVLAVRDFELFYKSIESIVQNTTAGFWGGTLALTAVLVLVAALVLETPGAVYVRYAVTTFLPTALVLAHVRGGGYRIGHGDSLNRMWLEILPLAVFFVAIAFAEGQSRRSQVSARR